METKTTEVNSPKLVTGDKIDVTRTHFHTILFGEDQLTFKKARRSQMIRLNSVTSTEQINEYSPALKTASETHF